MNPSIRMLGVWSGIAFFAFWLVGYGVLAQWIPPLPPSASAEQVASLYRERHVPILIGMALMIVGSAFYLPWTMLLSDLVKEIEGQSFFLSGTQLAAGVASMMTFFIPSYNWAVAAFRPERMPEMTQLLVDQGWLMFITGIPPFIMQYAILGIATFTDRREVPIFPRWSGYLQVWVSLSFLPAYLAFFFKTGPFAWNGLFVWWIPLILFTVWFGVMIGLCRKAVLRRSTTADA